MNIEPQWNEIDTVLLDMDGTLLDLHFDNYFWLQHVPLCYAEKNEMSHDDAHQHLMGRYSEVKGSLDWYCVDFWTKELSLDIGQLKQDMAEKIALRPEVISFLSWLNDNHKRVVLVTNAHPVSLELKMEKTGLHVHFDNIINSHDVGMAKEHDGFWKELQRFEAYDKDKTILIDDNLEVLESASGYGIRYCLGVRQPDSKGGIIESDRFAAIGSFNEILPASPE
jgi:putative hydrolase of the HAD superfamily